MNTDLYSQKIIFEFFFKNKYNDNNSTDRYSIDIVRNQIWLKFNIYILLQEALRATNTESVNDNDQVEDCFMISCSKF